MTASGFVIPDEPTGILKSNGTIDYTIDNNIITLQAKTQYQTALTGTGITGFTGDLLVSGETNSGTFRKTGGLNEFLKANGTVDRNSYTNIQYLQILSPDTILNNVAENSINGTGLTNNNMSMTWNDALYYSRTIYIAGVISHLSNAILTVRLRNLGGAVVIPWVIQLSNQQVSVSIPFNMTMRYTIKNTGIYSTSCQYFESGSTILSSHIYNANSVATLGNFARTITVQWSGASSTINSIAVTELSIKNNYVG
jgi:hypothetical protein